MPQGESGVKTVADCIILTSENSWEHQVADDLVLTVQGRLGSCAPIAFDIKIDYIPETVNAEQQPGRHSMAVSTYCPHELGDPAVSRGFIATVERLYPGEFDGIEGRLEDAFAKVAEMVAKGRFVVMDETVRCILEATERVQYCPYADRIHWNVWLFDKLSGVDAKLELPAAVWAMPDPGYLLDRRLPDQFGVSPFFDHPERWQITRSVWQGLAEIQVPPIEQQTQENKRSDEAIVNNSTESSMMANQD